MQVGCLGVGDIEVINHTFVKKINFVSGNCVLGSTANEASHETSIAILVATKWITFLQMTLIIFLMTLKCRVVQ